MSSDRDPADGWNNGPSESDDQKQNTEVVEVEEAGHNPHLSPETEALATFTEIEGPLNFKIIPVIKNGQTEWRVVCYMDGVQGTIYQSPDGLTDGARKEFGISPMLQDRINEALRYAKDNLEVPPELGDQKRQKRSLHELEVMMQEQE